MKHVSTFTIIAALLVASPAAFSCTCDAGEDKRQWVKDITNEATYVFLAKVGRVTSKTSGPLRIKDTAVVEIKRHLKGKASFSVIESAGCARKPVPGEERIFFVDKNGGIIPCTEYHHFFDGSTVIEMLESGLKTNAN